MAFNYNQFYSEIRRTLIIQERKYLRSIIAPIFESRYQKLQADSLSIVIKKPKLPITPDRIAIPAIKKLDNDVFENCYDRYYPIVEKTILGRGGNIQDALDAFQESMIDVVIQIRRGKLYVEQQFEKAGDKDSDSDNIVKTAIIGGAIQKWGKRFSTKRYKNESAGEVDENDHPLIEMDPFEETDRYKIMSDSLEDISENCKKLIIAVYRDMKNYDTIAKEFGYSTAQSAKNQKYKCMKHLRIKVTAGIYNV